MKKKKRMREMKRRKRPRVSWLEKRERRETEQIVKRTKGHGPGSMGWKMQRVMIQGVETCIR